jgi:hypothetical protein
MKKSLYNIEKEYLDIANQLEDGELTEELETALAINEKELQVKAVAYAYVIKDASDNIVAIDNEIKRLQALKKREQNKADRLKESISNAMNLYGITEIKTETLKLNFRRSEGVVGSNEWLTDDLVTIIPEQRKPNLTAIKAAIKAGVEIEGYEIEERYNLQIK